MANPTSTPADAVLVFSIAENRQEVLIENSKGDRRRDMTVLAQRSESTDHRNNRDVPG